jgi:arylsulfatase
MDFIERANAADKPFFVWLSATRMHVWTRLKPESVGRTGIGLYPDGMVEHDDMVGKVLTKLDELDIADNTIVIYSTDNGAESFTWPDGGVTPFHGEKGTTWEGGFRVPLVVRWPGLIEPGTVYNNIISQEDWMPTLLHAAGVPGIQEQLKEGYTANGKDWRVHLDGYDFLPFFKGEVEESPRDEIVYFSQGGELNAVRYRNWKVHFAMQHGNIATAVREVTGWPAIVNLRADPYEEMMFEGEMGYLRWYANNMWIFVPIQTVIKEFLSTIPDYPFQEGSSLNAAGINYGTLKQMNAMERLQELETLARPNN